MDIYRWIETQLMALPHVQGWPELRGLICTAVAARPRHWLLPVLACQSVGGKIHQARAGSMAIACLHTSILVLDDMLDSDPRGLHHQVGHAVAANVASTLQAIGLDAIATSEHPEKIQILTLQSLNQMISRTAFGQHLDIQNPVSESSYWATIQMKSGQFFGAALYIGALLGGSADEEAMQLRKVGELYGEMIQMSDDLDDVLENPASPDWTEGRVTLPLLYAQLVSHPDQERFQKLRQSISAPDALTEAQNILIRCGAVSYSIYQILKRHQKAVEALEHISLVRADHITGLLDDIVDPVRNLLSAATGYSPQR